MPELLECRWEARESRGCPRRIWPGVGWIVAVWFTCSLVAFGQSNALRAEAVAARLDAVKETLASQVAARLRPNVVGGNYTTVWRQFEDAALAALGELLPRQIAGLRDADLDRGTSGREKNRLADLAIRCPDGLIEISIKAARNSANPENDLGTFREHPNRKRLFTASFTLWVRYDDADGKLQCDRVFFDRSWRFVGKSSLVDGVKYRKKDGNMRPKSWAMFESGEAFWSTEGEFEAAVKRAELYRANELIKQYLEDLSESDQRLLHEKLKRQFAEPAASKPNLR